MTIEQFVRLFPEAELDLRRQANHVEGDSRMRWHAHTVIGISGHQNASGDTLEEALAGLAKQMVVLAQHRASHAREDARASSAHAEELMARYREVGGTAVLTGGTEVDGE